MMLGERCANVVCSEWGSPELYEPLDAYCADGYCPTTLADAVAYFCGDDHVGPWVQTRCGYVHVSLGDLTHGYGYVFDEAADELVGAYYLTDIPVLPCDTYNHYGGVTPQEACFDPGGHGGAANEGAAGGASVRLCGTAGSSGGAGAGGGGGTAGAGAGGSTAGAGAGGVAGAGGSAG
jgi:hypothetical protein